jgi:hypothetical protein
VWTLLGAVRRDRAYYHCGHCGHGWFPGDEELGIAHKQTPGCCEVVALTAAVEPFAEAAEKLLHKLTGLNLSASTVQVTSERTGAQMARRRAAGATLGPPTPWTWERDARGRKVAYTSLDATAVLQQGPHAAKAESRMPWVGSVFNPRPMHSRKSRSSRELAARKSLVSGSVSSDSGVCDSVPREPPSTPRVWPTRYVCGVMSLDEIGRQLRGECQAVGIAQADVVVALTDGGNGLEACLVETVLSGLAQEVVPILDFFHATEHLREFAKSWLSDESARREQVNQWCHDLKHHGGSSLLTELEALDQTSRSAAQLEAHRLVTQYIRNNQHRMDYPTYLANGWEIGSGEIESACQNVINRRLGGAGMRWSLNGTTALCQLRSVYRSESAVWQHYWNRTVPT